MTKKKIIFVSLLIFFVIYVMALVVPFVTYQSVTNSSELDEQILKIVQDYDCGDRALILETSESALEERIRLVNMAKEQIIISTFDLREGKSTDDFFAVLLQKANQGVQVSILVDGISGMLRMKSSSMFAALANHECITIKFYNPVNLLFPWRLMGRMHDKYVLVDDIGYIMGGRNTFDYFLGEYETAGKSLDREVLIYNAKRSQESSLYSLQNYFREMWNSKYVVLWRGKQEEKELKRLELHYSSVTETYAQYFEKFDYSYITKSTKGVHLIHNPTHIYGKEPTLFYLLNGLMRHGREQVIIHTPYVVLNDSMKDVLRDTNSVVPVTLFYNSISNGDNIIASSDYIKNYQKVLDIGTKILEFCGGISYHGKSIAIDSKYTIIGSYNFDLRSTYVNTEMMLVINSEDLTKDLLQSMNQLSSKSYEVLPSGISPLTKDQKIPDVSFGKKFLWKILGLLIQPFRFFV